MKDSKRNFKNRGREKTKDPAFMSTSYYKSRVISFDGEAINLHLKCRFRMKDDQSTVNVTLEKAQEYVN